MTIKIKTSFFIFCLLLLTSQVSVYSEAISLNNWHKNQSLILEKQSPSPARTAILIIAPPQSNSTCFLNCRWNLGKKVWEQYMNTHPNVDCYFLEATNPRVETSEQVWIKGNTIYVGDTAFRDLHSDRILYKTIAAIEKLSPHYTHFIRTNINTFFDLNAVNDYAETHHQSMYTGPLWQEAWYLLGYGILFTADVASHIASEYRRLEGLEVVSNNRSDDGVIASLATGIDPYTTPHPFRCCPSLPEGVKQFMCPKSFATKRLSSYGALLTPPIRLQEALVYSKKAKSTVMLYRTRLGFDLYELSRIYETLLRKCYPELPDAHLKDYVNTLPTIKEPS